MPTAVRQRAALREDRRTAYSSGPLNEVVRDFSKASEWTLFTRRFYTFGDHHHGVDSITKAWETLPRHRGHDYGVKFIIKAGGLPKKRRAFARARTPYTKRASHYKSVGAIDRARAIIKMWAPFTRRARH